MKKIVLTFFILYSSLLFAQKEANIWYFGSFAGLDFNSGSPIALIDGQLETAEGCATISDSNGNLLFYTDGVTVWNKNHTIMLNGNGLKGHISSTNSAIIIPVPENPTIYYIFTVDAYGGPNGLQYSEVDMSLDSGLGGITANKNRILITPVTEKLTAVMDTNDNDVWVVSHKYISDEFLAFHITNQGVNTTPIVSSIGSFIDNSDTFNSIGAIKISPDGTKLAVANSYILKNAQLFDFDATTGILSNAITLNNLDLGEGPYGIEFSSNSKILYTNVINGGVYQFDIYAGNETDINNSKIKLTTNIEEYTALQLAPDGKIYSSISNRTFLGAINFPNILGLGCNYQDNAISLDGRFVRRGLPPFIQSFFNTSFNVENVCFGDTTQFILANTVDSAVWDFGDVASGVNNTSTAFAPMHVFTSPGDYEVLVTVTVGTDTATKTSTVTIYEVPTATQPTTIEICDTNNDGFYAVDLTLQNATILNGQDPLIFGVKYYAGLTDFTNETEITTPNSYTNQTAYALETIYAKIYNINSESCFDSTNFTIQVFETPLPSTTISSLTSCDNTSVGTDNDGVILFDLTQKETDILNGQASLDFTVEYYSDAGYSAQIVNPAAFQNTVNPQTIYVKMFNSSNTNCVATTSFAIEVFIVPTATQPTTIEICDTDNDGFYAIDLTSQNVAILNGQDPLIFSVKYYAGLTDFTNETEISTPNSYTNQTAYALETIYAKVYNINSESCFDSTNFTIQVFETPLPSTTISPLTSCDNTSVGTDNDGIILFDLTQKETDILNGQASLDFTVEYYSDAGYLAQIVNPAVFQNTVNPQTIYVKMFNNTNNSCVATTSFSVEVFIVPTAVQPTDIKICDTNNDGFYAVDLTTQNAPILNGQDPLIFSVKYYAGLTNFTNETEITTPNSYINQTAYALETIYAKVYNTNSESCFDSTNFTIQVFETPLPSTTISSLTSCDNTSVGTDNDGIILFDLTQKETDILNGQASLDFTVEYYSDAGYSAQIVNPAAFQNTVNPQTIYVKMFNSSNTNCVATTSFLVEVFELPTITRPVVLKQCDDNTDGFSAFNLTEVENEISTNAVNETFKYYKTYVGATTNDSTEEILNPTAYTNQFDTTDTVWASVENTNGCYRVSEINLIVSTTGIPSTFQKEFYECDDFLDVLNDETDGITTFDFSSVTSEIESIFPIGQQLIINYYRNEADALAETNPILDISNYRNNGYPTTQTIYVRVDSQLDNDCLGMGAHITLYVEPIPIANSVTIDRQCDNDFDDYFPFDTATIEATVLNGQTGMLVSYVDENGNDLTSPLPNPFTTSSQTIKIRVTDSASIDPDGACYAETTLEFIVDKKPVANPVTDFIECDDDLDGLFSFDTSTIEATILNGQTGMLVSYIDKNGNPLSSPLPNPFLTSSQTISVKVENELYVNCTAETTINFTVHPKPTFELDEEAVVCLNLLPKQLSIFNPQEANYSYSWTDEYGFEISNQQQAEITQGGIYTVIATSINGCTSYPQEINILESTIASITTSQIEITDDSDNNVISVETSGLGIGNYEYAIQKEGESIGFYQDEPIFENISPGIYIVYVKDKNNCGTVTLAISVIGYPKFFTPNNDGQNDYWNVIGVNSNFYSDSLIHIFDRFGKLITTIDPSGNGWDGFYNGVTLPSTDYWFTVELIDKNGSVKVRKGHFSLIRR